MSVGIRKEKRSVGRQAQMGG